MKKLFGILVIILLSFNLANPRNVLGISPGDACSVAGAISDCPIFPAGATTPKTACCGCNRTIWRTIDDSPCPTNLSGAGGKIVNPVVGKFGTGEGAEIIAELIANALKITFSLSGLVLLGMLILGGFEWMSSAGNQETYAKAQRKITNALIGFVIYMAVFAIINYLAPLFGLEFLNILKITWPTSTP